MSRKEAGSKHPHSHRAYNDHLLKCYGSKKIRKCKNIDLKPVLNHTDSCSDSSSGSRHLEQRLRPRTCDACRACATASPKNCAQDVAVSTLLPIDQMHRLPYYSAKADRNKPKPRSKSKATDQLPRACNDGSSSGAQNSASSCSSSPHIGLSEMMTFPALPQSGLLPMSSGSIGTHTTCRSNSELRKWIVAFGGDVQAAFMARGLQRLQLAYEQGRAETEHTGNGALPNKN